MKEKKKDSSIHVYQRNKLKELLTIRDFQWTPKQKEFIEIILNKGTQIMFCEGPSGTAKSLLAVYCALKLLNDKKIAQILYVRNPVESSSFSLGFLKGELDSKFGPYTSCLDDKLNELLPKSDIDTLNNDQRIITCPLGFMRGASLNSTYILAEESQNFKVQDFLLLMTRLGKFSKMIFIGDTKQADIKNTGFSKVISLFDNEESKRCGIHHFQFGREDIMRNEILAFIIEKFESIT